MTFFADWLTVLMVGMVAIITPGPDFALTLRSSLAHSTRTGVYTAVGVGVGNTVHATYSLIGIGAVISKSILLFSLLKWVGALYLIYLGIQSLRAKKMTVSPQSSVSQPGSSQSGSALPDLTRWAAFRIGFFGNLLNPKATLFFLALFTQIVRPSTPMLMQAMYGLTVAILSFVWFALVALLISRRAFKRRILSVSHWLERMTGAALILLGFRLAVADPGK
ncbi:MAG: LysE family transporter [Cyanobacteria bacterium J06598_3]